MTPPGIEVYKTTFDRDQLIRQVNQVGNAWIESKTIGGTGKRTSAGANLISLAKHFPEIGESMKEVQREFREALTQYREKYDHVYVRGADMCDMLRYTPGQEYRVHADYAPDKPRVVSGLIYMNDDFEGGGLTYPYLDWTYQPVAGDLVLFPSNYVYAHAALPVESGVRYCIVTFFI